MVIPEVATVGGRMKVLPTRHRAVSSYTLCDTDTSDSPIAVFGEWDFMMTDEWSLVGKKWNLII